MTVLSAQSIRHLCRGTNRPLITPFSERTIKNGMSYGLAPCSYDARIAAGLVLLPRKHALACTIERFIFPANICGHVRDKSSYARRFVSVFNTHFDPGFEGFATIEIVNHGSETVVFQPGDPLCQFVFHFLNEQTEIPYRGKYQNQQEGPQAARHEI